MIDRLRAPLQAARLAPFLLLGLALAACQTTGPAAPPPQVTTAAPDEPVLPGASGEVVAKNKGWIVRAHPAGDGSAAYCLATPEGETLPRLAFRASADQAALLVRPAGAASDQPAGDPGGKPAKLTATFQDGASLALDAKPLPDGRVLVPVDIPAYYDVMDPFAESRTVTLKSELLDRPVADLNLSGSLWAINALDECRILHTEK